jgi:response regulator RpfG family c-di-GMP phosphodiesterase
LPKGSAACKGRGGNFSEHAKFNASKKMKEREDISMENNSGMNNDTARKKILYVDDLNFHLLSLAERLRGRYELFPAQSLEKMLEILENTMPGLILLDINMPGMDGFEILEKIKADPRYAGIPVIFVTAENDEKNIAKGKGLGAADFIFKPFEIEKFVECIEKHIG